jgi:hypothetical protein
MRVVMSIVTVAMLLSFAVGAFAGPDWGEGDEQFTGIHKGAQEVTALGFYNFGQDNTEDTWALGLGYGAMYTDNVEFGARLMGSKDLWFVLPSATWYFTSPGATAVPYVAADLGYMFSDINGLDDDFAWGGRVGVKFFPSKANAFFAEFQYLDYGADDPQEQINLGMAFYR